MTESTPRLLVDAMLGKLARWLRILGYDSVYAQGDDALIAHRARSEGRIVLTRDREMARRRGLPVLFIASQELTAQIVQVVAELGRPIDASPRCMACNVLLTPISVEEARPFIPPYVAETQSAFHRCEKCGKIYWQGTHWQGIERQLQPIRPASKD